ncbi:MAG: helix-turn-helix domain-containing protein [Promethearchaeia archaeon]
MQFERLQKYLKMLLYLIEHERVFIKDLCEEFGLSYQTVNTLFEKWVKQKKIKKIKRQNHKFGEHFHYYMLTDKTRKDLEQVLGQETEIIETTFNPEALKIIEIANELVLTIPEYLQDIGITVNQEKYRLFIQKLRDFFRHYDIPLDY